MRINHLELFENLVDTSFLYELDRVTITSDLNSQELMELSHVNEFELCLESQHSAIH
jgi:hypothetical protein